MAVLALARNRRTALGVRATPHRHLRGFGDRPDYRTETARELQTSNDLTRVCERSWVGVRRTSSQRATRCAYSVRSVTPIARRRAGWFGGPFRSFDEYREGMVRPPVTVDAEALLSWSSSASIPLLPSPEMADVFGKIRWHPSLAEPGPEWSPEGLRELNATDDRDHFTFSEEFGAWPVYKGESFDLWTPDTGTYFAWARPEVVVQRLVERQLNQVRNRRSAFFGLSPEWAVDEEALPANRPRIAWRDSTNRTNQRTVIACLVPPQTVLVHQAYYLFWRAGTERDEAFVLGVVSSIPFDWYARQMVETHVTVEFMDTAPIPRVAPADPLRRRVEEIAGRLAEWTTATRTGPTPSASRLQPSVMRQTATRLLQS